MRTVIIFFIVLCILVFGQIFLDYLSGFIVGLFDLKNDYRLDVHNVIVIAILYIFVDEALK